MTLEHATFFSCRKVVVLKVAAVKKSRRMTKDRWATLAGEFLRDVVVGGLAFVVDLGALVLAQELLFGHEPLCVQLGASGRTAAVRRKSEGTGVHEEI